MTLNRRLLAPKRWTPLPAPPNQGRTAATRTFTIARRIATGGTGPEDVIFDKDGHVLTGLANSLAARTIPLRSATPVTKSYEPSSLRLVQSCVSLKSVRWAVLAFAGVALLGLGDRHLRAPSAVGLAFAVGAAASWAGYISATAHVGTIFDNLDALALATVIGGLLTAPFAMASIDPDAALRWNVAGLAITVGLMCSVIPYSLELISLRSLPPSTFAVLTSLSPAIAALTGWFVLHQRLGWSDYLAVALVMIASIGAMGALP